jgi:hypothetical protein
LWNSGALAAGGAMTASTVVNGQLNLAGDGSNTIYALAPVGASVPNSPLP